MPPRLLFIGRGEYSTTQSARITERCEPMGLLFIGRGEYSITQSALITAREGPPRPHHRETRDTEATLHREGGTLHHLVHSHRRERSTTATHSSPASLLLVKASSILSTSRLKGWWLRGGTHTHTQQLTTATAARTNLHAHVARRTCRRVAAAVVARRRRPWTCAHTGSQLHYRRTLIDCVIIVAW